MATERKVAKQSNDLNLRNGGWIRTWFSVDCPGQICVESSPHVYANRLTHGEVRRLIVRLQSMIRKPRNANG